ncbi:MAG: T9SS type A sorting domain-containing protein [Flavisolibacter sp.]|nr:T9SS type A sorting domain-containing protein [Flavisolibacter sp.]
MKQLRPLTFLIILLFNTLFASAQNEPIPKLRCGTTEYYQQLFSANPALKKQFEMAQSVLSAKQKTSSLLKAAAVLNDTITIVVHVLGSQEMQSLMTDAIIQSQIDVLNEDYQGLNADSVRVPAAFKPVFGKSKIHFALARTNPYGEPTNGIVRKVFDGTFKLNNIDEAKQSNLGGDDAWDPSSYLNIWVVSFGTTGILGVSVFPGDVRKISLHGFVCDYRCFGRGAPFHFKEFNKGRTTTHELGHFFNLVHIWGDDGGSCSSSDFPDTPALDDTPNQSKETYGNPDPEGIGRVLTDQCSPQPPGIMYQNFMDYTSDSAMALFTKGQQARMENTMINAPDRLRLLNSLKYLPAPVYTRDARIRDLLRPIQNSTQCISFAPVIILRNSGALPLTSVQIVSVLNNTSGTYTWNGNLTPYTDTTISLPLLITQPGQNILKIYTSNPNEQPDENPSNDTVSVSFQVLPPVTLQNRFVEGFDNPVFPPSGWQVFNPNNDSITWAYHATVGYQRPGSAWYNDWNNHTFKTHDDLVTPTFTYGNVDSVFLHFRLAAAIHNDPVNSSTDTLAILLSRDCGNTYTTVYQKWGAELQTISGINYLRTTEFFPSSLSQWRRDSINLGSFLNESESGFNITFRVSSNYENNLFLDDVTLYTKTLPPLLKQQGYLILPTAFRDQFAVWHYQQPTSLRSITVYSSLGQLVWRQEYNGRAEKYISVNLNNQPSGVYFVRLMYSDKNRSFTQRVVKF